jgi:hypothetical protein
MVNKRRKMPIERLVLHAGAAAGMDLAQVNKILASVKLPPVPQSSWDIVLSAYSPWVREDIKALVELSFHPPPSSEVRKRRRVKVPVDLAEEDAEVLH